MKDLRKLFRLHVEGTERAPTFLIANVGSRGDLEVFCPLIRELKAVGVAVHLAANIEHSSMASALGVPFHPLSFHLFEVWSDPSFQTFVSRTDDISRLIALRMHGSAARIPELGPELLRAAIACNADCIVSGTQVFHLCHSIAQRLGIVSIFGSLIPFTQSAELPFVTLFNESFSLGVVNKTMSSAMAHCYWLAFGADITASAATLVCLPWTAPVLGRAADLSLQRARAAAASRLARECPCGRVSAQHCAVGYDPIRRCWPLSRSIPACLSALAQCVFVPAEFARRIAEGVRLAGVRAVVCSGWSQLDAPMFAGRADICMVRSVPHAWLFPRCAAVVHHGGIGTTAQGCARAVFVLLFVLSLFLLFPVCFVSCICVSLSLLCIVFYPSFSVHFSFSHSFVFLLIGCAVCVRVFPTSYSRSTSINPSGPVASLRWAWGPSSMTRCQSSPLTIWRRSCVALQPTCLARAAAGREAACGERGTPVSVCLSRVLSALQTRQPLCLAV